MKWVPRNFVDLIPADPDLAYRYEILDASGNPTGQYQYLRYAPGTLMEPNPTAFNKGYMQPIEDELGRQARSHKSTFELYITGQLYMAIG